jgi:hypothetical protein
MKALLIAGLLSAFGAAAYAQRGPDSQTTPGNSNIPNQGTLATPTDNGTTPAIDTSNRNRAGLGGSTRGGDAANSTNLGAAPRTSDSPNAKSDR